MELYCDVGGGSPVEVMDKMVKESAERELILSCCCCCCSSWLLGGVVVLACRARPIPLFLVVA